MPYSIYKRSRTFLRFAICSFSICGLVMAQLDTRYSDQRIVFPDRGDPRAKETASPASEGGPSAGGESLVNRSHHFHPNAYCTYYFANGTGRVWFTEPRCNTPTFSL